MSKILVYRTTLNSAVTRQGHVQNEDGTGLGRDGDGTGMGRELGQKEYGTRTIKRVLEEQEEQEGAREEQGSKGAREQGSKGAREQGRSKGGAREEQGSMLDSFSNLGKVCFLD